MLAVAGCKGTEKPMVQTPAQPAVVQAPATPLDVKKAELGGTTWDPAWDGMVEKALPADLLSEQAARAVRMYCPRFAEETDAEKREFWAYIFQGIAGAEAGLNPTSDVHHLQAAVNTVDPVTKRPARKDRALPVKDPGRTILSPENNLGCGVKIMENQIVTQGKPLVSRTSYWATLQPGTAGFRVFAKQMANVPEGCGVRVRSVPRRRPEIASQ